MHTQNDIHKISTASHLVWNNMGWLGDGSHRGQVRYAWTAVGLPQRYPNRPINPQCLLHVNTLQAPELPHVTIYEAAQPHSLEGTLLAEHWKSSAMQWCSDWECPTALCAEPTLRNCQLNERQLNNPDYVCQILWA